MVFGIVAAVVAVALAGCVVFLLKELENCRKKETEHTGMSLDQARECVQREVEAQRELMELMYFTCDNFQKHQQSIILQTVWFPDHLLSIRSCHISWPS